MRYLSEEEANGIYAERDLKKNDGWGFRGRLIIQMSCRQPFWPYAEDLDNDMLL